MLRIRFPHRVGAGPGEVTQAEARIDGGGNAALCTGMKHFFGKPQIAGLVAQRHMGAGDGDHAGGIKGLAQGKLDFHGVGGAFPVLTVQHGLLFIV